MSGKNASIIAEETFDDQTFPRLEECTKMMMTAARTWDTADRERQSRAKTLVTICRGVAREISVAAYIRMPRRGVAERD